MKDSGKDRTGKDRTGKDRTAREKPGPAQQGPRQISVRLELEGGHVQELELPENSPELSSLFRVLASRGVPELQPSEQFFQVPIDGGKSAFTFNSKQLVSVITHPPVVVQLEQPDSIPEGSVPTDLPAVEPVVVYTPKHIIIDNFLSADEHRDMLAFALANEQEFSAGTVVSNQAQHRKNLVIMNFHDFAHSTLIRNRLLTWYPVLAQSLGVPLFPVETVESQLTASNHGHYYGAHADGGGNDRGTDPRVLSCVYYFFRQPRPFSGGALRLYDTWHQGGESGLGDGYKEIEPVSNRLVVFRSEAQHELMHIRCPSRAFEDSRFAITNWIRRAAKPDDSAVFGWGHMHCGIVPQNFARPEEQR